MRRRPSSIVPTGCSGGPSRPARPGRPARAPRHTALPYPAVVTVTIRPRVDADLPALGEVLAAQQPFSRYPFRWPLPFPTHEFLVRPGERAAFVAEVEGRPVGHVSLTEVSPDDPFAERWAGGADRPVAELDCVSVLFVDHRLQGQGIGARLLEQAVRTAREAGRTPVLDVVQPAAGEPGRAERLYRDRGWQVVGSGRPEWLPPEEPDVLLMVLPEDGEPEWQWLTGRVARGHGVASGTGDTPYPAGAITLQAPHFAARGFHLDQVRAATVNVDVAPTHWRPISPDVTLDRVPWSDLIPPETFSFLRARARFGGREADGWVYYPHPETKPQHEQPETIVELLLPHLPGLGYGDVIEVALPAHRIHAWRPERP